MQGDYKNRPYGKCRQALDLMKCLILIKPYVERGFPNSHSAKGCHPLPVEGLLLMASSSLHQSVGKMTGMSVPGWANSATSAP